MINEEEIIEKLQELQELAVEAYKLRKPNVEDMLTQRIRTLEWVLEQRIEI